jgi:Cdc6-like AAA superfamily ATPase
MTIPSIVYGRSKEKDQIKEAILNKTSQLLMVYGAPGTGKTSTVLALIQELHTKKDYVFKYVNCADYSSKDFVNALHKHLY